MISVLIPAYNEAGAIVSTIQQVREVFDKLEILYEIIVIDDGSSDNTAEQAESVGVMVLQHPTNGGYGRSLKTALKSAQYEWCAIVDADATYPIASFPDLLQYIPQFDMVVGARTGENYRGSVGKNIGRQLLGLFVSYVIGQHIPDVNSGMRIFRRDFALAHSSRISSGFSFTTTLTLAVFLESNFVKYVPIDYYKRHGSTKVRIGLDSLRTMQLIVQSIIFYNPLKLFLLICIGTLLLGIFAFMISVIIQRPFEGFVLFIVSIFVAIVVGSIGFVIDAIRLSRINRKDEIQVH